MRFLIDYTFLFLCLLFGYFLLAGFVYSLFRQRKKVDFIYKIQNELPSPDSLKREIKYSIFSILIFSGIGIFTYFLYLKGYNQLYLKIEKFGILYFIISFFLTLFIHDFYFYWTHRLMHLPKFFTLIHKTHHLSHNPTAFAALSFHPTEALIQAAIIPILSLVLPIHPFVLLVLIIYNLTINIVGHAGYEFFPIKFKNSILGKISNTPVHHNRHHQFPKGNYGLYFSIWDKIMGTFYNETKSIPSKLNEN